MSGIARARGPCDKRIPRPIVATVAWHEDDEQLLVVHAGEVGEDDVASTALSHRDAAGPTIDEARSPRVERDPSRRDRGSSEG